MPTENALLSILIDKINNDTLVLPTLPAIALKVREAAEDPEVDLGKMANVIALDPSLSARIIKLANSAMLRGAVKSETVQQAVTRIGLVQIKNNAMALAMEQLFVSKNAVIKQYLNQIWERTVNVVSHTMVLFEGYQAQHRRRDLDADVMTLAALMHNIGVLPILTEAERHDDTFSNATFLNQAIQKVSGRIGGTITREWHFDEGIVEVAEHWRNLKVQSDTVSYIDFVRLGAISAGYLASRREVVLKISMQKGIISDETALESEEFLASVEQKKDIFG